MTLKNFSDLEISDDLKAVVNEIGFSEMTPIQAESIPLLLQGKDLIGQSKTGSGKTAAFALPILQRLKTDERQLQALVMCPTRELCAQVAREIRRLGRKLKDLQVLLLVGGQPGKPQTQALQKGIHIAVGTPGRILDHLHRGHIDYRNLSVLVLDEADRMLDMGFEEDVKQILEELPRNRQTVLFSATFPAEIKTISKRYQHSPAHVVIQDENDETVIKQFCCAMDLHERLNRLTRFLQKTSGSVLVFCNQKASVSEIALELQRFDVRAGALHGDLEQRDRDQVLALFRNGTTRVLVATDVAARGLDIESLDMVINFDVPHESEIYVHRIGRTGRAGKSGVAISLADEAGRARLREISRVTDNKVELTTLDKISAEFAEESGNESPMETLFISGGRKDKLRPGDILGALTAEAGGLDSSEIGKIEIHDRFSYVAVAKFRAEAAVQRLKNGRIKGKRFLVKLIHR